MKRCTRCGITHLLTYFDGKTAAKDGHASHCKACQRISNEIYKEKRIAAAKGKRETKRLAMIATQSPELAFLAWRIIPGFENYEVSEYGDVRRIGHDYGAVLGRLLHATPDRQGYPTVKLWAHNKGWKRKTPLLVALAFLGLRPFPGAEVAHFDDNPAHNHYSNLRWATRQENMNDRRRNGRIPMGEAHPRAKLTWEKAQEIRKVYAAGGMTQHQLGHQYGVTNNTICLVVREKIYMHDAWQPVQPVPVPERNAP